MLTIVILVVVVCAVRSGAYTVVIKSYVPLLLFFSFFFLMRSRVPALEFSSHMSKAIRRRGIRAARSSNCLLATATATWACYAQDAQQVEPARN